MRPSSASGCRTVVSAGVTIWASSASSNPTTERSSGTDSPRSRAACRTPTAMLSFEAKIAVGGSGRSSSRLAAAYATRHLEVALDEKAGGRKHTGGCERRVVTLDPLLGRRPAPGSGDVRDPPVPEIEQMIDRGLRPGAVRGRHGRDAHVERHARVGDYELVAARLQRSELVTRLLGQEDDRAVGRAVHQPLEKRHLAVVLGVRRAEDEAQLLLVGRL